MCRRVSLTPLASLVVCPDLPRLSCHERWRSFSSLSELVASLLSFRRRSFADLYDSLVRQSLGPLLSSPCNTCRCCDAMLLCSLTGLQHLHHRMILVASYCVCSGPRCPTLASCKMPTVATGDGKCVTISFTVRFCVPGLFGVAAQSSFLCLRSRLLRSLPDVILLRVWTLVSCDRSMSVAIEPIPPRIPKTLMQVLPLPMASVQLSA